MADVKESNDGLYYAPFPRGLLSALCLYLCIIILIILGKRKYMLVD